MNISILQVSALYTLHPISATILGVVPSFRYLIVPAFRSDDILTNTVVEVINTLS